MIKVFLSLQSALGMMQMVEDTIIEHAHTKPLLPSQLIRYREMQVPDGRSRTAHPPSIVFSWFPWRPAPPCTRHHWRFVMFLKIWLNSAFRAELTVEINPWGPDRIRRRFRMLTEPVNRTCSWGNVGVLVHSVAEVTSFSFKHENILWLNCNKQSLVLETWYFKGFLVGWNRISVVLRVKPVK